jgi:hypothetical protein
MKPESNRDETQYLRDWSDNFSHRRLNIVGGAEGYNFREWLSFE